MIQIQNTLIKTISYDQSEIIKWILHLHVPTGKIDCDPTYSIGNFYKNTGVDEPTYKFDITPKLMVLNSEIVETYH